MILPEIVASLIGLRHKWKGVDTMNDVRDRPNYVDSAVTLLYIVAWPSKADQQPR